VPKTYRCRVRLTGRRLVGMVVSVVYMMGVACFAQGDQPDTQPKDEKWSIHAQATTIGQAHDSFSAPYSGKNSLDPHSEAKASLTGTVFLGLKVRKGLELYVNPEIAGGEGFSGVLGMAGFPNGEITRVTSATPKALPQPRLYQADLGFRGFRGPHRRRSQPTRREAAGFSLHGHFRQARRFGLLR